MNQRLKAVFEGGSFVPQEPCELPDGSEVDLIVQGPARLPPDILDADERVRVLDGLVARMRGNPIPPEAPHLTRDELHGRG